MKKYLFNMAGWLAVLLLASGLVLAGCPTDSDLDPTPARHLIGGTIGTGEGARPFYADESAGGRNVRAARVSVALEGKIGDGGYAITLTGVYDERSGKFVLAAMSSRRGIGYAIEGFIKAEGPKDVKAVVKAKGPDGEWTETEVEVKFDTGTQVSGTAAVDSGEQGLPAAWTGLYPVSGLAGSDTTTLEDEIDGKFFGTTGETGGTYYSRPRPNHTGLGAKLVDFLFYSVTPWGFSVAVDFDGMDREIDAFVAEQNLPDMTPAGVAEGKKSLHEWLSPMTENFYYSFLEVVPGDAAESEDPAARYVLAFIHMTSEGSSWSSNAPEVVEKEYYTEEFFTRLKITFAGNALKMVVAKDISASGTRRVQVLVYDREGNFIRTGETREVSYTHNGLAATAAEARAAADFTETVVNEHGGSNVITLTR